MSLCASPICYLSRTGWPLTLRIMVPPCASEQGDEIDLRELLLLCDCKWDHLTAHFAPNWNTASLTFVLFNLRSIQLCCMGCAHMKIGFHLRVDAFVQEPLKLVILCLSENMQTCWALTQPIDSKPVWLPWQPLSPHRLSRVSSNQMDQFSQAPPSGIGKVVPAVGAEAAAWADALIWIW